MDSKEFKKVALYFNEDGYNENLQTQEKTKEYLQNIIDRIKSLEFTDFTKISLEDIFLNPKNFFIEQYVKGQTEINGIPLNKEKIFSLMEIPPEVNTIIEEIKALRFAQNVFVLTEKGQIIIKDEFKNTLREQWTIYAHSEKAKKLHDYVKNIYDNLKQIQQITPNINLNDVLGKYININANGNQIEINYTEITKA
jgi:hypothetical protein